MAQTLEHSMAQLEREGLSLGQLLDATRLGLLHTTRLFSDDLDRIMDAAAREMAPPICTARALSRTAAYLRTGLPTLDAALAGGLTVGTVTEIAGTAGSGKTQLCLHLAARAVLDDPEAHVVYVDTEHSFTAGRLASILAVLAAGGDEEAACESSSPLLRGALSRVLVVRPLSSAQLVGSLQELGRFKGGPHKVALVVIDSVGALVRAEFDRDARMKRVEHLTALSASIKRTADALQAVVVVANQVVRLIDDGASLCGELEGQAGARLQPSLGVAWAHNVNYRLLFQCAHGGGPVGGQAECSRRWIRVEKSPKSAQSTAPVRIGRGGLVE